jgi:hypothetical protein
MSTTRCTPHMVRKLSVRADADPRSVVKVLSGGIVRGSVDERIRVAMRELGVSETATDPKPTP